ncbi:hypothetical protein, partial [Klebsiella aerogenes]|uniref:hypothetical protein n=1 Tax=Klebsiella aerogenes TaxID=548 RepID=UPI0013D4FBA6
GPVSSIALAMGSGNASLKQLHPFQLSISFVDSRQRHKTQLLLKLALPLLLLCFAAALLVLGLTFPAMLE